MGQVLGQLRGGVGCHFAGLVNRWVNSGVWDKALMAVSSSATRLYSGSDSLIRELEQPLLKVFAGCVGRGLSCFDYPLEDVTSQPYT